MSLNLYFRIYIIVNKVIFCSKKKIALSLFLKFNDFSFSYNKLIILKLQIEQNTQFLQVYFEV